MPVYESNVGEESLSTAPNFEIKDLGDVIVGIQIQFQRFAWTPIQVKSWIAEQFGGRSRSQLTDAELSLLLEELRRTL